MNTDSVRSAGPKHLARQAFSWSVFPHACWLKRTNQLIMWNRQLSPRETWGNGKIISYLHWANTWATFTSLCHQTCEAWCLECLNYMLTTADMKKTSEVWMSRIAMCIDVFDFSHYSMNKSLKKFQNKCCTRPLLCLELHHKFLNTRIKLQAVMTGPTPGAIAIPVALGQLCTAGNID